MISVPPAQCLQGQFPCMDSVDCVDASARCDGIKQCPSGSDEDNCTVTVSCLDSDWTCQNYLCVPAELRCNGQNDCMDNSDESDCGEEDDVTTIGTNENNCTCDGVIPTVLDSECLFKVCCRTFAQTSICLNVSFPLVCTLYMFSFLRENLTK